MRDRHDRHRTWLLMELALLVVAFALACASEGDVDESDLPITSGSVVGNSAVPSDSGGGAVGVASATVVGTAVVSPTPTAEPVTPVPTLEVEDGLPVRVPNGGVLDAGDGDSGMEQPAVAPTQAPAAPVQPSDSGGHSGYATHYGESYNGRTMGCGGTYWSSDPYILAVGPAMYAEWPCGTVLRVTGPAGSLDIPRSDSCPGCSGASVDLSEAGQAIICGGVGNNCAVRIERVR